MNLKKFMEDVVTDVVDTKKGAMVIIITFHSLEEKLVNQSFFQWKKLEMGTLGTKKPLAPSE